MKQNFELLVLFLLLLFCSEVVVSFQIPIHMSNNHGPIISMRVGKPSVELKFGVNFTHDRCSVSLDMYGRSTTFDYNTQPHYDSNTLIGTELFRTGPKLSRMAIEVSSGFITSEYSGVIGLGRRSDVWKLNSKATFTSSVIIMDGIHDAFNKLSYVKGAPIDCLKSIDEFSYSEAMCVTYGIVLGKLYKIEIFGGSYHDPITLPSGLYDELFFSGSDELPTIEIEMNQSPIIQNRKKKEEKSISINRCISEYKSLGIHIGKNGCKNPYHYVMKIDPSNYVFESNEQSTAKNRKHYEFHIKERKEEEGRLQEQQQQQQQQEKKHLIAPYLLPTNNNKLQTITLGSGLLHSFIFHFDLKHHKLVILNRNTKLHITDGHLFFILLLVVLFVRWTLTNNVLNPWWPDVTTAEILTNLLAESVGLIAAIGAYTTSRIFDLLETDPLIFNAVTTVFVSLAAIEIFTIIMEVFGIIAPRWINDQEFSYNEFYAMSYRRISHTQLIFYAIWFLLLDVMSETFSGVASFILFFIQLYILMTNLFILRKHLWARRTTNIGWLAIVLYLFIYLTWSLYFVVIRHFQPFFVNFFNHHDSLVPAFVLGTLLFNALLASETSNYTIPVLI